MNLNYVVVVIGDGQRNEIFVATAAAAKREAAVQKRLHPDFVITWRKA